MLDFGSNTAGAVNLYAINADGSGKPERLTTSDYMQFPSSWATRSNAIAFLEVHSEPTVRTLLSHSALLGWLRDDAKIEAFWRVGNATWPSKLDLDGHNARFEYRPHE